MTTVILGALPPAIEAFLEERRRTGADRYDEVWEGEYHVAPMTHGSHGYVDSQLSMILGPLARARGLYMSTAFNLGDPDDFRVPDGGIHRERPHAVWIPTAALVVEVVSPGDESWKKLDFYARHEVAELLIVDPRARTVDWMARDGAAYRSTAASTVVELGPAALAERIDWPPID